MHNANPISITAEAGLYLKINVHENIQSIPYREKVVSFLFAARVCRPDIEYASQSQIRMIRSISNPLNGSSILDRQASSRYSFMKQIVSSISFAART